MNEDVESLASDQMEDCPIPAERWTAAQKHAKSQIFKLNMAYPGRWFTKAELDRVVHSTLDSLVSRGMLETKRSEILPDVRYFRATGKWIKEMYEEDVLKKK